MFLFICSFVHHTNNHQPFLHLVVMVTTLETPKNIFCGNNNIMLSSLCGRP